MSISCRGLVGWLLGHQFLSPVNFSLMNHCGRCGMPLGGWKK